MQNRHFVVGAGPVGTATALAWAELGRHVVVVTRSGSGPQHPLIERVALDAGDAVALRDATSGAAVIVNAANPPYHRWATQWPPLADSMLAAAQAHDAVLVTVSNLYGYGPVDGPITPDLPLAATGTKGRVRAQMWQQALAAHEAGRVRVSEVRGSDYVGIGVQGHLGDRAVPKRLAGKAVSVLGSADQPHSWTAITDVAATVLAAGDQQVAWGRAWHVPSAPPRTQREAIGDLCSVAGVAPVTVRTVPSLLLRGLGVVNPMMRELGEVLYQFQRPFVLDASATTRELGVTATEWEQTLRTVIDSYRSEKVAV